MKLSAVIRMMIFGFLLTLAGETKALADGSLVIFSGRKEPLIKPVISLFEETTGIDVIVKSGDETALAQQILQEKNKPSADVYIAKESGSLEYLRLQGAFQPYTSESTAMIPDQFKAKDGTWIGVSGRSRALIYNKDLVKPENVPDNLEDLTDPKWKGKIMAVHSGNPSLVDWVTALRLTWGDEKTEAVLNALKANDIQLVTKSHTDIRKAVGRGEYPAGLINHYYYHLQKHEKDPALTNVGIVYLDQKEGERGEIVNVSGAAIIRGAKNEENAKEFIDFLTSAQAQKLFAEVNFEYPLRSGVEAHEDVYEALGCQKSPMIDSVLQCIHVMDVPLDALGEEVKATYDMLDRVQWYHN